MDTRGGARGATLRDCHSRILAATRPEPQPSACSVDGACALPGDAAVSNHAVRSERFIRAQPSELSADQVRWLGVLLLGAQLPHFAFVPTWVAVFGPLFVVAR